MEPIKSIARGAAAFMAVFILAALLSSLRSMQSLRPLLIALLEFSTCAAIWYLAGGRIPIRRRRSTLAREAQAFFDQVNAAGHFPECHGTRLISRPDAPVLAACSARMYEVTTEDVLGHSGTQVLRQTVSTARNVVRDGHAGELAITPHNLIFSGDIRTREIELSEIIAVGIEPDRIQLSLDGGQNSVSFKLENSTLWGMLVKNLIQIEMEGRVLPPGARLQMA